jgi:hypothetical protein
MQREIEAQERAHTFQLEELKREMVADVGMLQATHMQEMCLAHEHALATAAASAPSAQPLESEPKVALHLVSTGLINMKHCCALARASCRMASEGLRSLTEEIISGLACAQDACSLMQQQRHHEEQYWKQRHDVRVSGQILAESVDALQQQNHQSENEFPVHGHNQQHDQHENQHDLSSQIFHQHFHEQLRSPHSSTGSVSSIDGRGNNSRNHPRHVRFMLADGPHEPGTSPAVPALPAANDAHSNGQIFPAKYITSQASMDSSGGSSHQDEDSLDESNAGEGVGSLQSYLGSSESRDVHADGHSASDVKFAQLWPPHQLSSLPPPSSATLNLLLQPHSPATIAKQLISHARGSAAVTSQAKLSSVSATPSPANTPYVGSTGGSLSPSKSAPSDYSCEEADAENEDHARELYGDYIWIVQKTQSSDDVGRFIQVNYVRSFGYFFSLYATGSLTSSSALYRCTQSVARRMRELKGNGRRGVTASNWQAQMRLHLCLFQAAPTARCCCR